jgi:2-polyprenyl-6-methoxyphenol hydroxylase-like FAD-dependent oxidoreductase
MRIAVVGAGPTGLVTAAGLARRGHTVTVVDRDPGPISDDWWDRRGVMQMHHPHGFRKQVLQALEAELPEAWPRIAAAGAEINWFPTPDGPVPTGFRCRRMIVERVLRAVVAARPGVELRTGHVDEVLVDRGRAAGVRVDGQRVDADLVVDASGRAGRLGRELRAPGEGADCGISYVSQQFRLRPGAEPGPITMPLGAVAMYPGYQAIVFRHDVGVFSALLARATTDRSMLALREPAAFAAGLAAVPILAVWTDPERSVPITPVLPGGRLHNTYRGQLDERGRVPVPGLVFLGDTVCTTNPTAGRGIATSLMQVTTFLRLLAEHPGDVGSATLALDSWCTEHIRPWFADHVAVDVDLQRRWAGGDVDLDRPLPSDLVVAATEADPSLMRVVGPYLGMDAPPASLAEVEPAVRALYASGWRPPVPPGPSRDELAALVAAAVPAPAGSDSYSATSRA